MYYADPVTTPDPPKVLPLAIRFGLLTGLAGIVFSLIQFLTKTDQSPLRWLGLLISVAGIYLAHKKFKELNGGYMEYSQGLGLGTLLSVVAGVLGTIFFVFYTTSVDTEYTQRMMDVQRAQMEAQGTMSDSQIDDAMAISAKFMGPGAMFAFGIFFSVLSGFIISLIVSAITKNSRPQFE